MVLQILTLTWQGKDKIKALKESLPSALSGLDYIWHIRDNGSTDGSVDLIKSWQDIKINLMTMSHNRENYAQGMNFLFKESSAKNDDIILTLNNDVIIKDPNSLKYMIDMLQKDKELGAVGAKLNYTDSNKIQHCGVLFSDRNGLPYHYRGGIEEAPRDKMNRYYPAVTGAVSMFPTEVFANCYTNKSGNKGFKEEYFFAFEDIDMSLRITNNLKKKIVNCGRTHIFHEESATLKKNPVNKMFFSPNCKLFLDDWHNQVDVSLTAKYENPAYNLYKEPK